MKPKSEEVKAPESSGSENNIISADAEAIKINKPRETTRTYKKKDGNMYEMVDMGGWHTFEGASEIWTEGKRASLPNFQYVITHELLTELGKHKLLAKGKDQDPRALEKALAPFLADVVSHNPQLTPRDITLEEKDGEYVFAFTLGEFRMQEQLRYANGMVSDLKGEEAINLKQIYLARTNPRMRAQAVKILGVDIFKKMSSHFKNISIPNLKIWIDLEQEGKDFTQEYIAAKKYLSSQEGGENQSAELQTKAKQAEQIVRAFEGVVLYGSEPNYRDFGLYNELLVRVKNYDPKERKQRTKGLVEQILANPEDFTLEKIRNSAKALSDREYLRFPERLITMAGFMDDFRMALKWDIAIKGEDNRNKKWAITVENGDLRRVALEVALEVLQKQKADPKFELPTRYFEEGEEELKFSGAAESLDSDFQPAVVMHEGTGKAFLRIYLPHPKAKSDKPEEAAKFKEVLRRLYLPLGTEPGELHFKPNNDPESLSLVGRIWQKSNEIFEGKNGFNPTTSVVNAEGPNPEFEFSLGLVTEKVPVARILDKLHFGGRVLMKIGMKELVESKKSQQLFRAGKLEKDPWETLTKEQQAIVSKLTSLLSQGGHPSILEEILVKNLNSALQLTATSGRRPAHFPAMDVRRVEGQEASAVAVGEVERPEKKRRYTKEDINFVRGLVYFLEGEQDLSMIFEERAKELQVKVPELVVRSLHALDRLLIGNRKTVSNAIKNTEIAARIRGKELSPSEELQVLIQSLQLTLKEVSQSNLELPDEQAIAFAENNERDPRLQSYFAAQYFKFRNGAKPNLAIEKVQQQFLNFWNSILRGMAERTASQRSLEAPKSNEKLLT